MMRNETFAVGAAADCATLLNNVPRCEDYLWRETSVGCKLLLLLQEIHQFNITYITGSQMTLDYYERMDAVYELDEAVDIYAKPRNLWSNTIYNATPISPIFIWKFGFILRSPKVVHHFYSLPFAETVWQCLMAMILLVSMLFYILNRAEQRLLGEDLECFFSHELLIAIGACCQHSPVWQCLMAMILLVSVLFYILNRPEQTLLGEDLECFLFHELLIAIGACCQRYLPVNPMELTSRRIAFISFFLFSYLIYSYYTSTLLSDIVHDKENPMDLETLADSPYGYAVLESVAVLIKVLINQIHSKNISMNSQLLSFIQEKLMNISVVNITTGMEEVNTGNTALLSDYVSLYPAIKQTYDINLQCELIKVHLFSNVHKYFFTSINFKYIEEFKRSTLWARETGVLQRVLKTKMAPPLLDMRCTSSHFQAQFGHVKKPLIILAFSYILSTLILLGERFYYNRYKVWPYVE